MEPVAPLPLRDALTVVDAAETSLLALGLPSCPACELLEVSLTVVAAARPGLTVAHAEMATEEEWSLRESELWPRDIRPSRSSMPLLVLCRHGSVIAQRYGGGPAHVIDAWVSDHLGPPAHPLQAELDPIELSGLLDVATLRQRHLAARGRRTT